MTDIAIRAENIGKQFRIAAHQKNREIFVKLFKMQLRPHSAEQVIFYAGRLLVSLILMNPSERDQVLSRITGKTTQLLNKKGRVGSLLEVGTGFHLELSGRENIYLSGAILGMRRSEIDKNFDEIVAFAEIDKIY